MKKLLFLLAAVMGSASLHANEYMKVADKLTITEDYQRCYQIKKGYSRKDVSKWEPYCGKINNFYYEEGYEYTILVDKYDPQAPEMTVVKTLARDNSFYYKRLKAKKDSIRAARAAQGKTTHDDGGSSNNGKGKKKGKK